MIVFLEGQKTTSYEDKMMKIFFLETMGTISLMVVVVLMFLTEVKVMTP